MSASTHDDTTIEDGAVIDGTAFAAEAQRLTNLAAAEEWLALYHTDAVVDWIVDGAREHHDGLAAIRPAATLMADLWRKHRFSVRKHLQCATDNCVVLSFDGTFDGRGTVVGTEIWTFRDGLVIHHRMSVHLNVRPRSSRWAQFRVLLAAPRLGVSALRLERKRARTQEDSGDTIATSPPRNRPAGKDVRK